VRHPVRQRGVKSWLGPGAFLQGHWSNCCPVLLPAPYTSRHRPLFWFLNCQEPSDCCWGSHWLAALPLTRCAGRCPSRNASTGAGRGSLYRALHRRKLHTRRAAQAQHSGAGPRETIPSWTSIWSEQHGMDDRTPADVEQWAGHPVPCADRAGSFTRQRPVACAVPMLNRLERHWSDALRKLADGEPALARRWETTMKLWRSLCARRCPVIFSQAVRKFVHTSHLWAAVCPV
jgi:hypothetical protein